MFVACEIWCLADASSVSPSSEQTLETSAKHHTLYPTGDKHTISTFVDQTHIQRTHPRRQNSFLFKTSLPVKLVSLIL